MSEGEQARQKRQAEEPGSQGEGASQRAATDEPRKSSGEDGAVNSNLDGSSSGDGLSSFPGHGEDADLNVTLDGDGEKARQKGAAEVTSSDGGSSKPEQEDEAMTDDSDAKVGSVGEDDQDEVGDTVMVDASGKEEPTNQAEEANPESEEP